MRTGQFAALLGPGTVVTAEEGDAGVEPDAGLAHRALALAGEWMMFAARDQAARCCAT